MEAKTDKKEGSQYRKKEDIGQFHDHVRWLEKTYPEETFLKVIVGKKHPVSEESNPPEDLRVITLDQFSFLADRIKQLYEYVASAAETSDVSICVERGLESLGLKWPKCVDSLESSLAIDLKTVEPPQPAGGD